MHAHLRLSWYPHPTPAMVEAAVIDMWAPPLNVTHSVDGTARDLVRAARAAYFASA